MRIVIVANTIEELGGAQRVAHSLARAWSHRDHDVELVGLTPFRQPHNYDSAGFGIQTLMSEIWPAKSSTPLTPAQRELRARLKAEAIQGFTKVLSGEPGVVIVTQVWGMEVLNDPALADLLRRWRVIGQYHGSFAAAAAGRDLARLTRAYANVDRMLALTGEDANAFVRGGLACEALPNPLTEWPEIIPAHSESARPHTITYLGRLSHEKGPDVLAQAWERAHEQVPSWVVQCVGSGPMVNELRERDLPRMNVIDAVADPTQILASTSILALPSRTEGFPMALAEAQAWGVPAVVTDCSPGVRELVGANEDPFGLMVIPEDPDAFAHGLITLAKDENLRSQWGQRAHEAMRAYRVDVVMQQWDNLFARIMN